MIQNTNGRNENWSNLIIINSLNIYITMWGRIDDSNSLISNLYISIPVNQLLKMCVVVGVHVDNLHVKPMIQFTINSELFHPWCRIWIGVRE